MKCASEIHSVLMADHPVLKSADRSTQIKTYSWDNAQVLLVGNKCDMEDERVVAAERGRQLSEQLGESERKVDTTSLFSCDEIMY